MTPGERMSLEALLEMLEGDRELIDLLREHDLLARDRDLFECEEVEHVLVARTLVRELEVNPAGVEIILRMRSEMIAMQRQVAELLAELRKLR